MIVLIWRLRGDRQNMLRRSASFQHSRQKRHTHLLILPCVPFRQWLVWLPTTRKLLIYLQICTTIIRCYGAANYTLSVDLTSILLILSHPPIPAHPYIHPPPQPGVRADRS